MASFARRQVARLIKPGNITKKTKQKKNKTNKQTKKSQKEKGIQFHIDSSWMGNHKLY